MIFKELNKLIIYFLESSHHENEENLSRYIQSLDNGILPPDFCKKIKGCCNKLWEIKTYGIKSTLIFEDDRNREILRLSNDIDNLKEKIEDMEDSKNALELVLKEAANIHKQELIEKDMQIQKLINQIQHIRKTFKDRIAEDKRIADEKLAIKDREIHRLKLKGSSNNSVHVSPIPGNSPITTPNKPSPFFPPALQTTKSQSTIASMGDSKDSPSFVTLPAPLSSHRSSASDMSAAALLALSKGDPSFDYSALFPGHRSSASGIALFDSLDSAKKRKAINAKTNPIAGGKRTP